MDEERGRSGPITAGVPSSAGSAPSSLRSSGWLEVTEQYGSVIPYSHNDFPVAIDGTVVAAAEELKRDRQGWTKRWPVTPGTHTLRLGRGWLRSPEVSFTVAAGQTARFTSRNQAADAERYMTAGDGWRQHQSQVGYEMVYGGLYLLCSVFKHDLWIALEFLD